MHNKAAENIVDLATCDTRKGSIQVYENYKNEILGVCETAAELEKYLQLLAQALRV